MPNPKRRWSKTRTRKHRTHHKVTPATVVECPNCGEPQLAHAACKGCGYYNGRKIVEAANA